MAWKTRKHERGAALVTVLMIVAAMSAVAVGISQSVRSSVDRTRLLDGQAQLRLYIAAGEEVVKSQLTAIMLETEGRLSSDLPGLSQPQVFPVEGGSVTLNVRDMTNCYDLNGKRVTTNEEETTRRRDTIDPFQTFLEDFEFDRGLAQTLSASLRDWSDADSISRLGGAEDAYYTGLTPAYRTSSQPLESVSEARAIQGFTQDVVQQLEGLVCVLPQNTLQPSPPLNINTLTERSAPRLIEAFSGALEPQQARSLILARPTGGWPDVEVFLQEAAVNQISPDLRRLERLGVVSSLVETTADVAYRGQSMRVKFLIEMPPGQPVRVLRRERVE
jgi:general secretion pathway protein K